MPTLRFDYPSLTQATGAPIYESVRTELRPEREFLEFYSPGVAVAELKAHALYIPLAPGDCLAYDIDTDTPLRLVRQVPVWTLDVDFATPSDIVTGQPLPEGPATIIARVTGEWQREAWVTQHTGLSFYVSAGDRDWLEDRVMTCKYVAHVDMIRYPDMRIDLPIAIKNADLGDLTVGPWA